MNFPLLRKGISTKPKRILGYLYLDINLHVKMALHAPAIKLPKIVDLKNTSEMSCMRIRNSF